MTLYFSTIQLVGLAGIFCFGLAAGELVQLNDDNIKDAVEEWFSSRESAEGKYGKIQDWDTSKVQNFHSLFKGRITFNEDISKWNTSSAVTMAYMFNRASSFNQNLSTWSMENVLFMDGIFNFAAAFNGDISSWNTGRVLSLDFAFSHASSFNSDISGWDTSSVKYMAFAFWNATSFSQNLNSWDVSSVDDIIGTFYNASAFDQSLCWDLNIQDDYYATRVFCNSQGSFDSSCGKPGLLTKVHSGCLEQHSFEETLKAESDASNALHDTIVPLLTTPESVQTSDSETITSPTQETTDSQPQTAAVREETAHNPTAVAATAESGSKLQPVSDTSEVETGPLRNPTTTGAEESHSETLELSSPRPTRPPTLLLEKPVYDPSSIHSSQSNDNILAKHGANLFYVAIAFASATTFLMVFLFFFVLWKRHQLLSARVPADACTVHDTDSEDGSDEGSEMEMGYA